MTELPDPLAPMGLAEIAAICGMTAQAAHRWYLRSNQDPPHSRHPLPAPDGTVSSQPAWPFRTVHPVLVAAGWLPAVEGQGQEERNERWPGSRAQAYNSHGLIIQTDIHGWVRVRDVMMDGTTAVVTAERVADGQKVTFRTPGERWYLTTPERP